MAETFVPPYDIKGKQAHFLNNADAFVNIADGPVRSGKTHVCLIRFVQHCSEVHPEHRLMIIGRTKETIKRNVIDPLEDICRQGVVNLQTGERRPVKFKYVEGKYCQIANRVVYIVGANDAQAESKVRGVTLAGAYLNEVTLYPEEVFKQVIARNSVPGARIFGDTNPDGPFHWLKKNYFENPDNTPESFRRFRFHLDDNPVLGEEYKENLKKLYTGLWYKRMIDGEWAAAAGAIYDMFDPEKHVVPFIPMTFDRVSVGVDYGTASVTTFVALGRNNGVWYLFREYYWDARETFRQKTNSEFADDFIQFLDGDGYPDHFGPIHPNTIEIDPSATGLKVEFRHRNIGQVRGVRSSGRMQNARNDVIEGIRAVGDAFTNNQLRFYERCTRSQEEHVSYIWDEEKQDIGEDVPVKENDHTCDAVRYVMLRHYFKPSLRVVDKPAGM